MKIDEINAGAETNALIAEILGYNAYKEQRGQWCMAVRQKPGDREPWKNFRHEAQENEQKRYTQISCFDAVRLGFFGTGFPNFSTDIEAAWEAWDWLKKQVHEINFTWCKDIYYLTIFDGHGNSLFGTRSESFPLAICRAVLKTKSITEIPTENADI